MHKSTLRNRDGNPLRINVWGKPSSLASGSPEPISRFQLHQPEHMERHLGLCFFWRGDVMKDYTGDCAMRGATILSAKLLTNLTFASNLVSRYYRVHGPLFPCAFCPSYGKRKASYLPPVVGGQQYCEHTTLVMAVGVHCTFRADTIYILCPSVSSIQTCHLQRKNRHVARIAGDRHVRGTRRPVWFRHG